MPGSSRSYVCVCLCVCACVHLFVVECESQDQQGRPPVSSRMLASPGLVKKKNRGRQNPLPAARPGRLQAVRNRSDRGKQRRCANRSTGDSKAVRESKVQQLQPLQACSSSTSCFRAFLCAQRFAPGSDSPRAAFCGVGRICEVGTASRRPVPPRSGWWGRRAAAQAGAVALCPH